jgi:hypothetical protein
VRRPGPRRADASGHGELLGEPEGEAEAPSDGVGVVVTQVTENGAELEVVRTGLRTSTLIALSIVPLFEYAVTVTCTCRVLLPADENGSVFHPGSDTDPCASTHRYSTCVGTRPTVNVAVNVGACAYGGGQVPEYAVCEPVSVTRTDWAGAVLAAVLLLRTGDGARVSESVLPLGVWADAVPVLAAPSVLPFPLPWCISA